MLGWNTTPRGEPRRAGAHPRGPDFIRKPRPGNDARDLAPKFFPQASSSSSKLYDTTVIVQESGAVTWVWGRLVDVTSRDISHGSLTDQQVDRATNR
jgi:hypothetical protein